MYIAASADKSSDFLDTKINPQTQNPLLKLFIQGGSACQYALNVERSIHSFYLKCIKSRGKKRKKAFNNR